MNNLLGSICYIAVELDPCSDGKAVFISVKALWQKLSIYLNKGHVFSFFGEWREVIRSRKKAME